MFEGKMKSAISRNLFLKIPLNFSFNNLFDIWPVDTVQDFLRKLGMKPHVHLVEISIFSLNNLIVRPTKIIKDLCKAST